jgi:hypothetical protein
MTTLVRKVNGRDEKYFKFLEEESEKGTTLVTCVPEE